MGRLYVGTLTLLCSLLLTVMVTILTPLSPADGHPAADDLHGRLQAGAAARADLGPDDRLHGAGDGAGRRLRRRSACSTCGGPSASRSRATEAAAVKAKKENRHARTSSSSRSRPTSSAPDDGPGAGQGLAVVPRLARARRTRWGSTWAQEQSMKEPRSHIEGATPSTAIWSFGIVPDPFTPPGRPPGLLNRTHPGRRLPPPGHDRVAARPGLSSSRPRSTRPSASQGASPTCPPAESTQLDAAIARNKAGARAGQRRVRGAEEAGRRPRRPGRARPRPAARQTRPTQLRGRVAGAPLAAGHRRDDLQRLPDHQGQDRRAGLRRDRRRSTPAPAPSYEGDVFPIKEYYTNQRAAARRRSWPAPTARCGSRSAA